MGVTLSGRQAWLAVAAMLAFSFAIRVPDLLQVTGAFVLEGSYHVLLTMHAWRENSFSDHLLLPTVTLGRPNDAGIPWGATVPTASGDFVYTSFPPAGFLAPYLFFQVTGLEPAIPTLTLFNFLLQTLSCVALYALLLALLETDVADRPHTRLAALAGVSVQIFSHEALISFGLVYWSQALFQPVLIVFLLLLLSVLRRPTRAGWRIVGLGALAFLGVSIEPTAFPLVGGTILVLIARGWRNPAHGALIVALTLGVILAVAVFISHMLLGIGPDALLKALLARFVRRSGWNGSVVDLAKGYGWSFGLLALAAIPATVLAIQALKAQGWRVALAPAVAVFLCAMMAASENIILMQHAAEFSCDRLKVAVPLAMMVCFVAWRLAPRPRATFLGFLVLALIQNYWAHRIEQGRIAAWTDIDRANRSIVSQLREQVDLGCAIIGSNIMVRGYAVLLLHRNIHETMSRDEFRAEPDRGACARVYLPGAPAFPNLPRFSEAIIEGATPIHIRPR